MNHRMRSKHSCVMLVAWLVLLCGLPMLVGCSSYAIQGRVVRGPVAMVQIVSEDDARLTEPNSTGGGAQISGVLEPNTPTERLDLGSRLANDQGYFTLPVEAFGSSFLEYEAQLIARRKGNQGAFGIIPLPRGGERVLITLPLGEDRLLTPSRLRDEALRDAEPYLRDPR